jgi:hypothetical protein
VCFSDESCEKLVLSVSIFQDQFGGVSPSVSDSRAQGLQSTDRAQVLRLCGRYLSVLTRCCCTVIQPVPSIGMGMGKLLRALAGY